MQSEKDVANLVDRIRIADLLLPETLEVLDSRTWVNAEEIWSWLGAENFLTDWQAQELAAGTTIFRRGF